VIVLHRTEVKKLVNIWSQNLRERWRKLSVTGMERVRCLRKKTKKYKSIKRF